MRKPPLQGTSLRAWFGLFAVACAWLALFANFPGNARQLLDVVWHIALDRTPFIWRHCLARPDWRVAVSALSIGAAVFCKRRLCDGEYCIACIALGWCFSGMALVAEVESGWAFSYLPRWTVSRVDHQMGWLIPVLRTLVPTLILTLCAQALGVVSFRPRSASERWLTYAWLLVMANIGLLIGGGLLIVENAYYLPEPQLPHPSLAHGGELFTPGFR